MHALPAPHALPCAFVAMHALPCMFSPACAVARPNMPQHAPASPCMPQHALHTMHTPAYPCRCSTRSYRRSARSGCSRRRADRRSTAAAPKGCLRPSRPMPARPSPLIPMRAPTAARPPQQEAEEGARWEAVVAPRRTRGSLGRAGRPAPRAPQRREGEGEGRGCARAQSRRRRRSAQSRCSSDGDVAAQWRR